MVHQCLRRGDAQDWEELVGRVQPVVAGVAARSAARWGEANRAQVEDLTQDAFLKLCRDDFAILQKISDRSEDAMIAFIKVTVANLVHDHFRAQRSGKRHPRAGLFSTDILDQWLGETQTMDTLQRELLLREIDKIVVRKVTGPTAQRDRRIFWLHHRQGMSARAIAAVPGIGLTDKGVESTLYRVNVVVKEEMAVAKGISAADA